MCPGTAGPMQGKPRGTKAPARSVAGPRWPSPGLLESPGPVLSERSTGRPSELRRHHRRQKGLEGSAADPPVRWRGGESFLWPVTSRDRPSPTVATADPWRPRHTKRDGRRPLRREPRDKRLRRDAVAHRSGVVAAWLGLGGVTYLL